MQDDIKIQEFGYSEMYEWLQTPQVTLGKFVTFNKEYPEKIELYGENENDLVLGVTTINSSVTSDNPQEWQKKYKCDEIGDILLQEEVLAVGGKQYDENLELSFIRTYPWKHYIKILNEKYDDSKQYVQRTNRNEWVRVNLIGKCIVFDDGECKAGDYCTPYTGNFKDRYGTAVKATENSKNKYYVLKRFSPNSILILYK